MNENAAKPPRPNAPCYCGSGKKYKKCHRDRDASLRRRDRSVYIGHDEKPTSVSISPTGEVVVQLESGEKVKPNHVLSVSEYEKVSGGTKTLNLISGKFVPSTAAHLAEAYDACFAVDTNTRRIGDTNVSVGGIIEYYSKRVGEERVEAIVRVNGFFAFRGLEPGEAERFSWWKLVDIVRGSPIYTPKTRVALITDHDRGNHERYSRGEVPIYDDHYLPVTFTLMYASTDAGGEDLLNFLLMKAEKQASVLLRQLAEKGEVEFEGRVIRLADLPEVRRKEPPGST